MDQRNRASNESINDKLWRKVQQFTTGTPSRTVWTKNEAPRTITKNSQRGIIEVWNAQGFRTMGKIEIWIFEYLKHLAQKRVEIEPSSPI